VTLSENDRAQIRRYLDGSNWMQLATTRGVHPRISHHWFAPDDDLNLYIITRHTRIHSHELALNPHIAGGIALPPFDGLGTLVFGATFQGTATQTPDDEIEHAWTHYRQRFPFVDTRWNPGMITTGAIESRIYKITPTVFRIFDETLNIPGNILQIRL
jgi:uncharacterized protein YhbP (UPF0306 family)